MRTAPHRPVGTSDWKENLLSLLVVPPIVLLVTGTAILTFWLFPIVTLGSDFMGIGQNPIGTSLSVAGAGLSVLPIIVAVRRSRLPAVELRNLILLSIPAIALMAIGWFYIQKGMFYGAEGLWPLFGGIGLLVMIIFVAVKRNRRVRAVS